MLRGVVSLAVCALLLAPAVQGQEKDSSQRWVPRVLVDMADPAGDIFMDPDLGPVPGGFDAVDIARVRLDVASTGHLGIEVTQHAGTSSYPDASAYDGVRCQVAFIREDQSFEYRVSFGLRPYFGTEAAPEATVYVRGEDDIRIDPMEIPGPVQLADGSSRLVVPLDLLAREGVPRHGPHVVLSSAYVECWSDVLSGQFFGERMTNRVVDRVDLSTPLIIDTGSPPDRAGNQVGGHVMIGGGDLPAGVLRWVTPGEWSAFNLAATVAQGLEVQAWRLDGEPFVLEHQIARIGEQAVLWLRLPQAELAFEEQIPVLVSGEDGAGEWSEGIVLFVGGRGVGKQVWRPYIAERALGLGLSVVQDALSLPIWSPAPPTDDAWQPVCCQGLSSFLDADMSMFPAVGVPILLDPDQPPTLTLKFDVPGPLPAYWEMRVGSGFDTDLVVAFEGVLAPGEAVTLTAVDIVEQQIVYGPTTVRSMSSGSVMPGSGWDLSESYLEWHGIPLLPPPREDGAGRVLKSEAESSAPVFLMLLVAACLAMALLRRRGTFDAVP